MKRISILGLGYIGLPTAVVAAESGYEVFGFDVNQEKIKSINSATVDIQEDEINERLNRAFKKNKLRVGGVLEYADCFIIAVPTPFTADKKADLSHVFDAAREVAKRLMPGNLVIIESTVPLGTTEKVANYLEEHSDLKQHKDFYVAHCPERVLPGKIFHEITKNSRVVGGICHASSKKASSFYAKFVTGVLHVVDARTAEVVKLIENSSRDVQISFANQVNDVCKAAGIDTYQAIELANQHPRVNILSPTCGVGGHCIAVDPWFLINDFPQATKLLQTARKINDQKPQQVVKEVLDKVKAYSSLTKEKPTVLGLGLTFKPDVSDYRESPALKIATELGKQEQKLNFIAYDPHIELSCLAKLGVPFTTKLKKALQEADIVVVLVKHKMFMNITQESLTGKVLVDTCGLLYDLNKQVLKSSLANFTHTLDSIAF